jgi:hypothetical protein
MKKGDFIWGGLLVMVVLFFVLPVTNEFYLEFGAAHPFVMGFAKFFVLGTMGEMLAPRLITKNWIMPKGLLYRAIIWGLIGWMLVVIMPLFNIGVVALQGKGLLPFADSQLSTSFFTSFIMNLAFAPAMMMGHKYTDAMIDLYYKNKKLPKVSEVVDFIDWQGFIGFVCFKTIPFFWIPAHTITFMLPSEYRVLAAAFLGIALGLLVAIPKMKTSN